MGAARFSLGAPSDSLWPVTLSHEPWRIRFGAAFGKGFATSEPQRNDPVGLVLGHQSLARNLFFFGRLPSCRSHLEEVLALHNPIFDGSLVHQVGNHPHVNSQAFFGIVLFCLGYPDLALAQSTAAIAEARRLAHPPSLASILALDAVLVSLVGDDGSLCERANEVAAVATEQGSPTGVRRGRSFAAGSRSKMAT